MIATRDMSPNSYDVQRRIGLLTPSSNTVMEPDFYDHVPAGWTVHSARMWLKEATVDAENRMLDDYVFPAARDIASAKPHVIVFGCTSAGALRGNDYDAWLLKEIEQRTGTPTVSVIKSVRKELRKISASNIVVVTPYMTALNERIRSSLESDNMKVLKIEGMGISENLEIAQVTGHRILEFAYQAVGDLEPDALFISCTNLPAMRVLKLLRKQFPFQVVTSNQAALETAIEVVQNAGTI